MMTSNPLTENSVAGSDAWSDTLEVENNAFSFTITGAFVGTLTLQVATEWRDLAPAWIDDQTFDKPRADMSWPLQGKWLVRIGFKAGDYTSGSATIRLYRGEDDGSRAIVTKRIAYDS